MTSQARPRPVRFRGRSYLAFALAPEPPIADWLVDLDTAIRRSAGFFAGRPAVLDLANTALAEPELAVLIKELEARDIRIEGEIVRQCPATGCWFYLDDGRGNRIKVELGKVVDNPQLLEVVDVRGKTEECLLLEVSEAISRMRSRLQECEADMTASDALVANMRANARVSIHVIRKAVAEQ